MTTGSTTTKKLEFTGGDFVINTKNGKFASVAWYHGGPHAWIMYWGGSRNVSVRTTQLIHAPTQTMTDYKLAKAILTEHECNVYVDGECSELRSGKLDTSVAWVNWSTEEMLLHDGHSVDLKDLPSLLWALAYRAKQDMK